MRVPDIPHGILYAVEKSIVGCIQAIVELEFIYKYWRGLPFSRWGPEGVVCLKIQSQKFQRRKEVIMTA
jgi:hypothetical protein